MTFLPVFNTKPSSYGGLEVFKDSGLVMLSAKLAAALAGDREIEWFNIRSKKGPLKLLDNPQGYAYQLRRLAELKENSEVFMSTNPVVYDYSLGRTEARENPAQVRAFDEEEYKQGLAARRSRLETAWQTA